MSIEKSEGYNVLSEGIEEKKFDKSKTYIVLRKYFDSYLLV